MDAPIQQQQVTRAESSAGYLAEDRGGVLVGISVSMAVLTTVILALRFYAKRFQGGGFFADDAFTVASYMVNLGMCAVGILITEIGSVGRHVEYVEAFEPGKIAGWAQGLFAFELIYFTSIALPKLAIICLYLRLFNWKGTMRVLAWVLFALVTMTSLSLVVAACFQCIPIAYWWDRTIAGGHCFDIQGFFHAQAVPGFILDVAIMALPMETIWRLNLPRVKRFALLGIFAVASFGIVASIIRAKIFFGTAAFSDETMASVDLIGWSIIETSVYIITNCLPHLRPLVSHYAPECIKRALRSSLGRSTSYGTTTYGDATTATTGKHHHPSSKISLSGLKSSRRRRRGDDDEEAQHQQQQQRDDLSDDTIELTRQRADLGLDSPREVVDGGGMDSPSWTSRRTPTGGSTGSSGSHSPAAGWESSGGGQGDGVGVSLGVSASKVECCRGSTGEDSSFQENTNEQASGASGLGCITVTREVKLTRT